MNPVAIPPFAARVLEEAIIARVATTTPSGLPHAAPFWYSFDGVRLVLDTLENTTVRNLRNDPHVAVLVDLGTRFEDLRGTTLVGTADVHSPATAPDEVVLGIDAIRRRHAQEIKTSRFEEYARKERRPVAYVSITPQRVHWWDLAYPGGRHDGRGDT